MSGNSPLSLVCVMPLWQRPALTALILRQWHYQIHRLRGTVDLHLVTVGSEGKHSAALVSGYADTMSYVEHDNQPLNQKWNAGIAVAKHLNPDAVLIVGSDDLLSDSLWLAYQQKLQSGSVAFGLRDFWFLDATRQQLGYWAGYTADRLHNRVGEPVGCGRCHARSVMEAADWRLWPDMPERNTVLDRGAKEYLAQFGIRYESFAMADLGPTVKAVDIKAEGGITEWSRIPYKSVQRGAKVSQFLTDLVDSDGQRALLTQWRTAA